MNAIFIEEKCLIVTMQNTDAKKGEKYEIEDSKKSQYRI